VFIETEAWIQGKLFEAHLVLSDVRNNTVGLDKIQTEINEAQLRIESAMRLMKELR